MKRGTRPFRRRAVAGVVLSGLVSLSALAGETRLVPPGERALLDSAFVWEDVDSAIVVIREISARYSDDPYPLHHLGRRLIETQRPELLPEAERVLLDCLAKNPTEPWVTAWATLSLAHIYYQTGRDSLAEAYCRRVIDMNATVNVTNNARRLMSRHRPSDDAYTDWMVFESRHFRFHFHPQYEPLAAENRAFFTREYESAYDRLAQFWCVEPDGVVEVYVHPAGEVPGSSGHHAFPERREIQTSGGATPGHELTHVFAYVVNPHQASAVLSEGIAVVLDQWRSPFAIDGEAFEALQAGGRPSVTRMTRQFDYRDDYRFAASFVSHLVREYGADQFHALYECDPPLAEAIQTTYGVSFSNIEAPWQARLASMGIVIGHVLRGTTVLDQPGEALKCVDHALSAYGEAPELTAARAGFLNEMGRHEEAMAAASAAAATRGDPTVPLWVAREGYVHLGDALMALGRKEEARAQYRAVIAIGAADNWTDAAKQKLAALQ